jgi:hypothetical protein
VDGLRLLDLLHLVDLLHLCRHRIDLLQRAVILPTPRIGQHRPMCPLHPVGLARIVHHTLELVLIQQRPRTD